MFDPHQLKQNLLQEGFHSRTNHNAFIDFEDDHTIRDSEIK